MIATEPKTQAQSVGQRGRALYEKQFKAQLEPQENGKYIVLDVDSGEYLLGDEYLEPLLTFQKKYPQTVFYIGRVGFRTAARMGGRRR